MDHVVKHANGKPVDAGRFGRGGYAFKALARLNALLPVAQEKFRPVADEFARAPSPL